MQGVGECVRPGPRLMTYIRRISQGRAASPDEGDLEKKDVKIVQHFLDSPHDVTDMRIMLVDRIPGMQGMWQALRGPVRRRWELVWMDRLKVELNKLKDWRRFFGHWGYHHVVQNW